jgi:hypothetical protein
MLPPAAGAMVDVSDANPWRQRDVRSGGDVEGAARTRGAHLADAVDESDCFAAGAAPGGLDAEGAIAMVAQ